MTSRPAVLTRRELNRATLARQLLLERSPLGLPEAIEHLVGLQAQTPHTAYIGLWTRLREFDPEALATLMVERRVVRLALMRSTIHLVTAPDAVAIRPLVQTVLDRGQRNQFARRLAGVDQDEVVTTGRAFVEREPRTFRALGDHLLARWPGRDRSALEQAVRTGVPLVQVPPRGLWRRSGPIAHTSLEAWLGDDREEPALSIDDLVRRYLGAFGPASVMDAQAWCGLTRLGEVFERLRPSLAVFRDEGGRELFDLPDAPRPGSATIAPPRLLYDFDNLLLSHVDRTRVITPEQYRAIMGRNGPLASVFLLDGTAAGTWRLDRAGRSATLVLTPFVQPTRAELAALTSEAEGLLAFLTDGADVADRDLRVAVPGANPWAS